MSTRESATGMIVKMKKSIINGAIMKYAVLFLLTRNHVHSALVISVRVLTCFSVLFDMNSLLCQNFFGFSQIFSTYYI